MNLKLSNFDRITAEIISDAVIKLIKSQTSNSVVIYDLYSDTIKKLHSYNKELALEVPAYIRKKKSDKTCFYPGCNTKVKKGVLCTKHNID